MAWPSPPLWMTLFQSQQVRKLNGECVCVSVYCTNIDNAYTGVVITERVKPVTLDVGQWGSVLDHYV